ncbi:MAG: hypothetical protein CSB55_05170 [Candidatus Cloacimonadota bacterium]|nr:MAG: hypothetical protein CSB55_05170 [Candidatus Cloacimonadota bacterium]
MKNYIVLDLGGSSVKYGVFSDDSLILSDKKTHQNKGANHIYETIFSVIDKCMKICEKRPSGIVLGSPGYIDTVQGKVIGCSPNLKEWENAEPKKVISEKYNMPVQAENDANLMVFGEASVYGYKKNVLGYTFGTGIGSGFIQKDEIFCGSNFAGSEAGHTVINPKGRLCGCGKIGCIEAYASASSIFKIFNEKYPERNFSNIKAVLDQCQKEQKLNKILTEITDLTAVSIANTVSILNPEVILIGGGLSEIASYPFEELKEKTLSYIPAAQKKSLIFEKARFGNKAALIGGLETAKKLWG